MTPITKARLTRSINLLMKRNKEANARCEAMIRESAALSQSTIDLARQSYNHLKDAEAKLSKSIQRRECKLKKLKAKIAEIQTMQLV